MKFLKREMLKHMAGINPLTASVRDRQAIDDIARHYIRGIMSGVFGITTENWNFLPSKRKGCIEVDPFLGRGPATAVLHIAGFSRSAKCLLWSTGSCDHVTNHTIGCSAMQHGTWRSGPVGFKLQCGYFKSDKEDTLGCATWQRVETLLLREFTDSRVAPSD